MNDEKLTPEEEQRIENDLKALDLELTHGATTFISDDAPPEIVKQFLDNVAEFEANYENASTTTVYEFIGKPDFPPADALADDEAAEKEIARLMSIFNEQQVAIDRPDHLTSQGFYSFLINEFFPFKMPDFWVPGMIHGFLYDEIRRDAPIFMEEHVEEFLEDLLNLEGEYEGIWLSEHCRDQFTAISKTEAIDRIRAFRALHEEINFISFRPQGPEVTEVGVYFFYEITWEGQKVGTTEKEVHAGTGICQMGWEDGEWLIQGVLMPGFAF